jgi:SAM-dependent methyltransferase
MSSVPKDVIILPEFSEAYPDRWVAMNMFTRTCLGVTSGVLNLISQIEALSEPDIIKLYGEEKFSIWDIERFPYAVGSLADPTCYIRDLSRWGTPLMLGVNELISKLKHHSLVIDNEETYRSRFQLKKNLMDKVHFGNYHQQVGQHLLLVERKSPSKFWLEQKFAEDLQTVRSDNLYGAVQSHYLESYFRRKISSGDEVLDVGCGTGVYANMMAKAGAKVLGIDPSEEYIKIASSKTVGNTRFEIMDIGSKGALDSIPDNSADFIFMSDALLFYFVPVFPERKDDIQILFADLRRILKPNGIFVSLEPHPVFWLSPWLGNINRPFTIVTEYMNKNFGVIPTTQKLIQAFAQGGFAVTFMDELLPDLEFKSVDPRAYYFANEFPVWHLFELKKMP